MRTKNKSVLLTGLMALAVCLMPAEAAAGSVGTRDAFSCPVEPTPVQSRTIDDSTVVLEKCWSARGAWMYRGNVYNAKVGDVLKVVYVPIAERKFVEHSENRDEHDDIPSEWYPAVNGFHLQACLNNPELGNAFLCTMPGV
nr:hypothetical protein [Kibdelosporangium sp. MJ126-NF4]CEL13248.1 hypothetical protein [Kibdelosporangium sp. MJ126-NF4]CTQ98940.1 hypothetical protein [Kibdelosporangium sp. MJ126-NF4]